MLTQLLNQHGNHLVRAEGLEPPCLAAPDPKSGMSTNFTTPAAGRKGREYGKKILNPNSQIPNKFKIQSTKFKTPQIQIPNPKSQVPNPNSSRTYRPVNLSTYQLTFARMQSL